MRTQKQMYEYIYQNTYAKMMGTQRIGNTPTNKIRCMANRHAVKTTVKKWREQYESNR